MIARVLIEIFIAGAVVGIDMWSKYAATQFLLQQPYHQFDFIKGFMDLRYTENTGASWGTFSNQTFVLTVFTALALAILLFALILRFKKDKEGLRIPLILIFAGGLGNLIDRIMFGYVRDFLEFTFFDFPIFNVADSAISIGAVLLVVYLIIEIVNDTKEKHELDREIKKLPPSDNE